MPSLASNRRNFKLQRFENVHSNIFTPRTFHIELIDELASGNVIACLESENCKYFVVTTIIKELNLILPSYNNLAHNALIITSTDEAAREYFRLISAHTRLSVIQLRDDSFTTCSDDKNLQNFKVIIATTQTCLSIGAEDILSRFNLQLIIFDDCHLVTKKCPYQSFVNQLFAQNLVNRANGVTGSQWRSVALTCCVLSHVEGRANDLASMLEDLETMFGAKVSISLGDLANNVEAEEMEVCDLDRDVTGLVASCRLALKRAVTVLDSFDSKGDVDTRSYSLDTCRMMVAECLCVLDLLGPWCLSKLAQLFFRQLSKHKESEAIENIKFDLVLTLFASISSKIDRQLFDQVFTLDQLLTYVSSKVIKLVKILYTARPEDNFTISPAHQDLNIVSVEGRSDEAEDSDNDSEDEEEMIGDENRETSDDEPKDMGANPWSCKLRSGRDVGDGLASLVFVKRKYVAYALNKFLTELCNWDVKLYFIRSHYVAGTEGEMNSRELRRCEDALRKFRQCEYNLLVATDLLHARLNNSQQTLSCLDVPKCNLVISFDAPTTYKEYIGCKARARGNKSRYIVLVDSDYINFKMQLFQYNKIQQILEGKSLRSSRKEVQASVGDAQHPTFKPNSDSPLLTIFNATKIINKYCARLPSDTFTHLAPICVVEKVPTDQYVAHLRLPINSPLSQQITGLVMENESLARMSVAYNACCKLYQMNELDDQWEVSTHLMTHQSVQSRCSPPDYNLTDNQSEEDEWQDPNIACKPGSTKRKQYYMKRTADCLQNFVTPGCPILLYRLTMHLKDPIPEEQNVKGRTIHDPGTSTRSFALLTTNFLPNVGAFVLWSRCGEVSVSLDLLNSSLILDNEQITRLSKIHQFIFQQVLRVEKKPMIFHPQLAQIASLIVIVNSSGDNDDSGIDWKFIEYVEKHKLFDIFLNNQSPQETKEIPKLRRGRNHKRREQELAGTVDVVPAKSENESVIKVTEVFEFRDSDFEDAVVMPSYRNVDQPQFFYVAEVRRDLSPLSPFPSPELYPTFLHYYQSKYGLTPTNVDQPLLDVDHTSARLNLLTPRYINQKGVPLPTAMPHNRAAKQNSLQQKQILVPEFCMVHPFPASLWRKVVCLPTIIYRLNHLLVAQQWLSTIQEQAKIPPSQSESCNEGMDQSRSTYRPTIQSEIRQKFGPTASDLMQTLMMSNANDLMNLERLETVGDSFLKFATTIHLYLNHKNVHEGKLSYLRSLQVSNYNLYKLGRRKGLSTSIIATKFEPLENWLPPGYIIPPDSDRDILEEINGKNLKEKTEEDGGYCLQTEQSVADKSIADCVEALIGCYLATTDHVNTLRLMRWFGLQVLSEDEPIVELNCRLDNNDTVSLLDEYLVGYDQLEERIGYKFRERAYLLQAFTHASFHYNRHTDCYQRLEFLGDAILDYVITRHLFNDQVQHSPGVLTDLRSALVNNNIFACLSIKWGLHRYLRFLSPPLFHLLDRFSRWVEVNGEEAVLQSELKWERGEEGADMEIPKVLGDIFESLAGAIYLDSGCDLEAIWDVYYTLMHKYIGEFMESVPKSPVRELLELEPETAKFQKPERRLDGLVRVVVRVMGRGEFVGVGRNYRIAKTAAAKRALYHVNM